MEEGEAGRAVVGGEGAQNGARNGVFGVSGRNSGSSLGWVLEHSVSVQKGLDGKLRFNVSILNGSRVDDSKPTIKIEKVEKIDSEDLATFQDQKKDFVDKSTQTDAPYPQIQLSSEREDGKSSHNLVKISLGNQPEKGKPFVVKRRISRIKDQFNQRELNKLLKQQERRQSVHIMSGGKGSILSPLRIDSEEISQNGSPRKRLSLSSDAELSLNLSPLPVTKKSIYRDLGLIEAAEALSDDQDEPPKHVNNHGSHQKGRKSRNLTSNIELRKKSEEQTTPTRRSSHDLSKKQNFDIIWTLRDNF